MKMLNENAFKRYMDVYIDYTQNLYFKMFRFNVHFDSMLFTKKGDLSPDLRNSVLFIRKVS